MLTSYEFKQLANAETNARKRIRLLALSHFADGHSRTAIAGFLKVARSSVNAWVASYLKDGLAGLESRKPSGRPPHLSVEQYKTLSAYIEQCSQSDKGGRVRAIDIQAYIESEFGVHYKLSNIYRLLGELGFAWITSRSKHPKQTQAVQEAFKKPSSGNDP